MKKKKLHIKLINFKFKDNERFSKPLEINFEPNKKRTDNKWNIFDDNLFKSIILLGKNASGKSIIVDILLSYFHLQNKEAELSKSIASGLSFNIQNMVDSSYRRSSYISNYLDLQNDEQEESQERLAIKNRIRRIEKLWMVDCEYEVIYLINNIKVKHKARYINDMISPHIRNSYYTFDSVLSRWEHLTSFSFKGIINSQHDIEDKIAWFRQSSWQINNFNFYENAQLIEEIDKDKTKRNKLLQFLKAADPKIQDFELPADGKKKFYVATKYRTHVSWDELSDGTQKVFKIICLLLLRDKYSFLMVFDEIDNFLNKELVGDLIMNMFKIHSDFQLIATSHSPYVFDMDFRYDSIYQIYNSIEGHIILSNYGKDQRIRSDKKLSNHYTTVLETAVEGIDLDE